MTLSDFHMEKTDQANFFSNKDFELLMFLSEMNRNFLFHLCLIKLSCKILQLTVLYLLQE